MKRILFFFAAVLLLSSGKVQAQGSNCASATPFCGNTSFPNNTSTTSQSGPNYGCLLTQPNPAWFFIKSTAAGTMNFNISQVNTGGAGIDVDFIAWGPFGSMTNACNNLGGSAADCSYSPAPTETMTLTATAAGQYFVILITNYADQAGTITFNQTSGPPTDCSITCPSVTNGNGYLLTNGNPVPSTVACSAAPFGMIASNNAPFGNPITPGIMISFTSNANNTLQINWYENSTFILCSGPAANGCGIPIPTNTDNDIQYSTMSPTATNQIEFCETSTTGADIPYTITDVSSGTVINSGTWTTNAGCTTITFPPGTITGIADWTISPACPGCLLETDWGYAEFNPGVAPAGTYNICYSFNPPGTCPTYTYCQNITVTNPNNPAWTAPPAICANGASFNLNTYITGTTGGTWSGTGVSGSTFNPAVSGAGTFNVTYTVGSGTCAASQVHTITVNPVPTVSITPASATICSGQSVMLTATPVSPAGGTYLWSPGGATTSAITVSPGSTTTYTVTYTVSGCSATATRLVTVNPMPTIPVTSPAAVCAGASATITTTPNPVGGTFSWSPGGATTQNLTASPAITTTYTVTYTLSGCSNTGVGTITVNPVPTVGTTATATTICAGQSTTITATPVSPAGGTYSWSPGGSTTSAITVSPGSTTTYTVTYTVSGCSATATRLITVNPTPTLTMGSPAAVCAGSSATITSTPNMAGGTYVWSPGGATTQNLTASPATTTTYTVTYTLSGCSNTGVGTITVNPIPTVGTTATATTICAGQSTTITASPVSPSGGTYSWSPGGATTSSITVSPGSTTTYTVTYTVSGCSATATRVITVNPIPTVFGSSPSPICAGSSTTIIATPSPAGGTYSWLPGGGTTQSITVSPASTTTYTVTYTLSGCSATGTSVVTVNPMPTAVINPATITICAGQSATLNASASSPAGGTYSWSPGGATTSSITVSPASTTTYTVTYTLAGCVGTATRTITVNPMDNANFNYGGSTTFCQTGTNPNAVITGLPGGTFSATPGGLSINASTGTINLAGSALNTYNVTYTTNGTCPNTFTLPVTITSAPSANFTFGGPYCQSAANPSPTFGAGASAGTFSASPAGLVFVNVNTGQINLASSTPGTYSVTNSIAAGGGCSAASFTYNSVVINPSPFISAAPATTQTICSGSTTGITLSSSVGGTSYNWTVTQSGVTGASAGSGSSIAQTLSTTGAAAGTATYTVTSTAGGCAGNTLTVTITVNPLPTVTPSALSQTICSGNTTSISLNGSPGATFAWAAPTQTGATGGTAGTGSSIVQSLTATGSGQGSVTYNIVPTANSCAGTAVAVTILVNPAPVANAAPSTICSGATTAIALSSTVTGTTYTWTANNGPGISGASAGSGSTISQTLTNSGSSAGVATYTVTPSASGCPGAPITVNVTVNPVPFANVSGTTTICSGTSTNILLSGAAGTTFSWGAPTQSGASGGTAGSGSTITQTLLASGASSGTVTYNVVPSANSCSGPAVPVVITVNPIPFVTASPSSLTICSGTAPSPAILLSSFTTGTTFNWTAANGAGISGATAGSGSSISQVLTNTSSGTGTAVYTVTPSASGCTGSPINVTVTVNPVANVMASPPGLSICSGSTASISLSTSVTTPTTFSWVAPTQTGASGGSAGSGTTISQVLNATGTSSGVVTYTVIPTTNSCPGTPLSVSVTVNPNPVGTAVATPASICSGTSTTVNLSSNIPGTTYSWTATSSGATGGAAGSGSTISQVLTATGTTAGTVTYNVIATTPAGCSSSIAPVTITVNPTPNVTATPTNATICSGSATGISLFSDVTGATFTWTVTQSGVSGSAAGSGSTITQTLTATGTTPGSAVYTITPSASGCASGSPVTVTITVTPLPVATAAPATQSICDGSSTSIALSSNLGSTTYSWTAAQTGVTGAAAGSGSTISQLLNLTVPTAAGSVVYTVTPTDNGCPGTPISVTVNVNTIDNAAFNYSSSTYCITGVDPSATITGTSGGSFSFTPVGLAMTDTLTGLIDLSASTLGSYNITYQTNGACPSNSIVTITITNAPSAVFSYTSVCSTDPNPVPNFGPGASAGTFSASPAGLTFVDPATGEIDLANSTAGTYTITNSIAAGGGCAAASSTNTITIDQAATVDAGVSDTICELGTFSATGVMGGSAGSVTWTSSGSGSFDNASSLTPVYTPSAADVAAGTVVLTVTTDDPAGGCPAVNDFAVLTITPLDSANFAYSGSTFCASGTNPIPVVSGLAGGMFTSSPAGLVFINALTGEIDLANTMIGTYDIVYSTNGPCPSSDTASITITTAPVATFTFTAAVTSFCQTDANPVPQFATGASAGAFTASPSGLVFVSSTTGEVDLLNSTPGTYTIVNNIVAAGGCAAATDSLTITINQPAIANAGNDTTICAGSIYTITGASIGGSAASSTWTSSGSGTFDNDSILNPTYTPSAADTASGSVTLYLSTDDPAGVCNAVVDSLVLTLTPLPQSPVVTNPAPYCAGSAVGPITFPGSGGTVNWYSDAGLSTLIGTGNPFTPTGITGTDTIYVTETVGSCGSISSQVIITFNPLPVADTSAIVISGATCGQATGSITNVTVVSGQSPFTYVWQDSLGNVVGNALDLTNVGPGVYTLTITDGNGCSITIGGNSGSTVTSTSGVTASFTPDVITGEKPLLVNFTNTSAGAVSYTWMFPDGTISNTVNANFIFTELGMNTICLIADNGVGCLDTACADIDVFQNSVFVIPNVFTPNGDDVNDVFTVKNVGLETMDAQIFNRWGQKQYEWHTTNGGWDGRTAAGVLVPDGTYFFIISAKGLDGKEYFEKGSFELIR
jgi:gliding motility-associated-like protein